MRLDACRENYVSESDGEGGGSVKRSVLDDDLEACWRRFYIYEFRERRVG